MWNIFAFAVCILGLGVVVQPVGGESISSQRTQDCVLDVPNSDRSADQRAIRFTLEKCVDFCYDLTSCASPAICTGSNSYEIGPGEEVSISEALDEDVIAKNTGGALYFSYRYGTGSGDDKEHELK